MPTLHDLAEVVRRYDADLCACTGIELDCPADSVHDAATIARLGEVDVRHPANSRAA